MEHLSHGDNSARVTTPATSVEARLETADLYARVGDYAQALTNYVSAWPRVLPEAQFAIARKMAYCQARLGRHAEAVALLEPMLQEASEAHELTDNAELGRCWTEFGNSLFELGELDRAQAAGLRAIQTTDRASGPDFGVAHNLLGGIALRVGDADLARTHFRSALDHFRRIGDVPNLAFAYNNLGHVYKHGCEWERALEHYQAAYFLRATEGEYQDQGAIHQNLGVALAKIGRFGEARSHLERSLSRAIELGDLRRAQRARVALAKLARETYHVEEAERWLTELRREGAESLAPRESVLVLLEEARLDWLRGDSSAARRKLDPLRGLARAAAPRGDLVVEVFLLQAEIALEEHSWEEATEATKAAQELSRADRDREQENRAAAIEMRLAFERGEESGEALYVQLRDRFQRSGERPASAKLHESRAHVALEHQHDAESARQHFERALDLWRSMGCERAAGLLQLQVARCQAAQGHLEHAARILESVREALGTNLPAAGVSLLRHLAGVVEGAVKSRTDGEWVLSEIEKVAGSDSSADAMRAGLMLLIDELDADGGVVAREQGESLEVVSTVSMGWLSGRRTILPAQLGIAGEANRLLASPNAETHSALVVCVSVHGTRHRLYLERRDTSRRTFTRSDLRYAELLVSTLARRLPRTLAAPVDPAAEVFEGVRHGIYVADFITQDPKTLAMLNLVRKAAASELTVLLQGETGTGKKLLAQAIHRISDRRDRGFVTVDCAALPETLLESELFGHKKGAFTGASQDRVGLLEEANCGTVFLDEIDKAGLAVQRRFLHLLDSGEVRPVGDTGYRRLDVRVVCATSCADLRQEVAAGRFIKDLYYRLNDIAIAVPSLRERPDDVPLLAECFIETCANALKRRFSGVSPAFHEALRRHDWPGNVRELEKAVRRAVALADDGTVLGPESLPPAVLESDATAAMVGGTLKERVEGIERQILIETLERVRWNKSQAALALGLTRKGLKGKIVRFGLDRRGPRR